MRESLKRFSNYQEKILKENDYKGGWTNDSDGILLLRAVEELTELKKAIINCEPQSIKKECGDVANFMMMIFDNQK